MRHSGLEARFVSGQRTSFTLTAGDPTPLQIRIVPDPDSSRDGDSADVARIYATPVAARAFPFQNANASVAGRRRGSSPI
jgi:hypothetical protein